MTWHTNFVGERGDPKAIRVYATVLELSMHDPTSCATNAVVQGMCA